MSNKSKQLAAMMALALASGDKSFLSSVADMPTEGKAIKPVPKVIPKGMTEYEFSDGFRCYALNVHNAIKKYNKWIKNQETLAKQQMM